MAPSSSVGTHGGELGGGGGLGCAGGNSGGAAGGGWLGGGNTTFWPPPHRQHMASGWSSHPSAGGNTPLVWLGFRLRGRGRGDPWVGS